MKQIIIITNNPLVIATYSTEQLNIQKTMWDVFIKTRDYVHLGHKLLSHPLPGSVKPNETPYKSIMVSLHEAGGLDFQSLTYIESAMRKYEQFQQDKPTPDWPERILNDFQLIDYNLFTSGYESLNE